ncbi:hypothetical protein PoB_000120600 [Plakobranchus ocellatus]|uniref:Uncharacterized protein n=1 Tax=Plakobranchus ocellatus TaxID=259542 RepID=A0AAV3XV80_9GAST|nr:hypothetical protein PoB_000120600 [Plakobranchus ocellatus]
MTFLVERAAFDVRLGVCLQAGSFTFVVMALQQELISGFWSSSCQAPIVVMILLGFQGSSRRVKRFSPTLRTRATSSVLALGDPENVRTSNAQTSLSARMAPCRKKWRASAVFSVQELWSRGLAKSETSICVNIASANSKE